MGIVLVGQIAIFGVLVSADTTSACWGPAGFLVGAFGRGKYGYGGG